MKLADEIDEGQQDAMAKVMGTRPELAGLADQFRTVGHDSLKLVRAKPE